MKFKERVFQKYYTNSFAQSVANGFFFVELNLGIITFAHAVSQLDLIADNLPYVLFNMTFLSKWSLKSYLTYRSNKMYLSKAGEVKGEDEATQYLDCLSDLSSKIENEEDDIILVSIRKRHELDCKDANCFCADEELALNDFIRLYICS